jgi:hypothetical protein
MEFLVQFLKEENHAREDDDRHQLDFTPGVIQVGHTFLHESSVAGKKIRFFEFLVLLSGGRFGVDFVVNFDESQLALLFGHLGVYSNENILQDQKTICYFNIPFPLKVKMNLDEAEDLLEFKTFFRLLPGRLDERIDE